MIRPATASDVYLRSIGGLLGLIQLGYAGWFWWASFNLIPWGVAISGLVLLTLGWLPALAPRVATSSP